MGISALHRYWFYSQWNSQSTFVCCIAFDESNNEGNDILTTTSQTVPFPHKNPIHFAFENRWTHTLFVAFISRFHFIHFSHRTPSFCWLHLFSKASSLNALARYYKYISMNLLLLLWWFIMLSTGGIAIITLKGYPAQRPSVSMVFSIFSESILSMISR